MNMQRITSGAAGNGLYTTIKYMRSAAGIGLGTTIKYLRRTTSADAGSSLGTMIKSLRRKMSAAANNGLNTTINPPCIVAAFVVNSEPHTGASPSVRLCLGPELARCVHNYLRVCERKCAWQSANGPCRRRSPLLSGDLGAAPPTTFKCRCTH
jgi:hypothetical protein